MFGTIFAISAIFFTFTFVYEHFMTYLLNEGEAPSDPTSSPE